MTKTLTEQWREGTLPEGYYYIRWSFNIDDEPSYMIDFCDTENFTRGEFINKQRKFIDEVMCVVPSYDEYRELLDLNVYEKDRKKVMGLEDKIKRLQEQLKDAREVIKIYAETTVGHKQKDGTYRLSVATGTINFLDPFFGMTSEMQEYVYDPRPAKKYLKKWGVK